MWDETTISGKKDLKFFVLLSQKIPKKKHSEEIIQSNEITFKEFGIKKETCLKIYSAFKKMIFSNKINNQ